jgi:serine/threonine protein kinase
MSILPELFDRCVAAAEDAGWRVPPSDPLGGGGGGVVYRCVRASLVDEMARGFCATKIVDARITAQAVLEKLDQHLLREHDALGAIKIAKNSDHRLRREIKAMKAVRHPNLIRVFDHDAAEEPAWYAMEYHPDGSLKERGKELRGKPIEVLARLLPMLEALEALHAVKVIHRDIKPANVFVGRDGRWILADLGVAYEDDATRLTDGEAPVSRDWAPPWRITPSEPYDAKFDLFMVTKLVFFLIHGEKLTQISWLRTETAFDLGVQLAHLPGVGALKTFFTEHLVETKSEFPSANVADYRRRVERVLKSLRGGHERLLFSLWSTHSQTHLDGNTAAAHGIPVRLGEPTSRLVARAVASRGLEVSFEIAAFDGSKILGKSNKVRTLPMDRATTDEMVWQPEGSLLPGWYRLDLRLVSSTSGILEGFVLYAE